MQQLHKVQYKRVRSQIILKECKKTEHSKGSTLGKRAGDQAEKAAQHAGQLLLTLILAVLHRIHVSCPSVMFQMLTEQSLLNYSNSHNGKSPLNHHQHTDKSLKTSPQKRSDTYFVLKLPPHLGESSQGTGFSQSR